MNTLRNVSKKTQKKLWKSMKHTNRESHTREEGEGEMEEMINTKRERYLSSKTDQSKTE